MSKHNIYDQLAEHRRLRALEESQEVALEEEEARPPARFHTNEFSFVRPEGMQDVTWHVLADNPTGPGFTIVVGRAVVDAKADLETLAQQVQGQLTASAEPQFTRHLHEFKVADRDARRMQFRRRQQGTLVHQDQVLTLARDENGTPLLVQFIATSANPTGMPVEDRTRFEALLASVMFRGDDTAEGSET